MFNRKIDIIKKNQIEILELKNTMNEMKNATERVVGEGELEEDGQKVQTSSYR